jgi:hypothetical protein
MRLRDFLVLLILAGSALPAAAACPPAGQDAASLAALKQQDFVLTDPAAKRVLALGLVDCLGDRDPAVRDGIAYEALARWMRAGDFDPTTLRALQAALRVKLAAPDPDGVLHPFAALVLSEVARTDRVAPWMSPAERASMLADATGYLVAVRDYRGFEAGIGWRHGVAHGSDWLLQLAINPALDAAQLQHILDAVAVQAVPAAGHAYVFGEPARLARPLAWVARRGVLSPEVWTRWLAGLRTRLGPMPAGGDAAWLARKHDLDALLGALYIDADLAQNEALRSLKPLIAKTLTEG